ncbi:MAG: single-stranded DNA-binding protein [Mitsuokella sp.]|uniref:single-stranded DNA-binding protein n=1 Tax=Mitsuokella sp. TaxID=2049034 RepID=UPI003F0E45CA
MNQAELVGRFTADPVLRTTKQNRKVLHFFLATQRHYSRHLDKEPAVTADFIPCVAWNGAAECLAKYCKKGSRIGVRGPIRSRTWDTPEGQKKFVMEIRVDEFEFLGKRKNATTTTTAPTSEGKTAEGAVGEPPEKTEVPTGGIILESDNEEDEEDNWFPPVPNVY